MKATVYLKGSISTLVVAALVTVLLFAGPYALAITGDGQVGSSAPQSGPQQEIWGDGDCSGGISPVDSLKILRNDAGLSSLSVQGLCPGLGSSVAVNAVTRVWGDGDCSGTLNPVDSLKTLRFDAGLSAPKVDPTCPDFGELVTIGATGGQTLLNEVLFVPGVGDDPFVELKTTGGGADPSGLLLVNERDDQFVVPSLGPIDGDDVLQILVEMPLYLVELTNRGAGISSWRISSLKRFARPMPSTCLSRTRPLMRCGPMACCTQPAIRPARSMRCAGS